MSYAELLAKNLRMLRERMEEAQLAMVTEGNERRQHHPFRVGDEAFLDTRLLPVGYANISGVVTTTNSRRRLHPVFNVARLKLSSVDKTRSHPLPPPLLRSTAVSAPEYEVEAILSHQGSVVRDLKYLVKWV